MWNIVRRGQADAEHLARRAAVLCMQLRLTDGVSVVGTMDVN